MIAPASFPVLISSKHKVIKIQALSVEIDVSTGQIVILPGHVPLIGKIGKRGLVTIKELSGQTTVLNLAEGLFTLDKNCSLTITSF